VILRLVTIALLVASSAHADPRAIDARVRAYVDAGLFSGVVLVSRGDRVVFERAYGLADRTFGAPNTTTTKFHIASLSKPITAAAVLLLADRGMLSLTDPVSRFVPGFPRGDQITIEQLLTHYSGLADASSTSSYDEWSRFAATPAALVDKLAALPPRGEPGKAYFYSNSNYHLLALVIEKASGMSYGEFLAANLFKPLGMTGTAHPATDTAIVDHLASGYMLAGAAGFEKPPYLDWTSKTGNGSLYSTVRDLLAFHRALQHGGLLKPDTVAASYGFDRSDREVGMFWFHRIANGHRAVYVSGSSPGFKAHFERFIDDDACVIVLSNLYIAAATPIARDIAALLWEPHPALPPVPRPAPRSASELERAVGRYQFGHDFYQPDATVEIAVRDGALEIRTPGFTATVTPLADGSYFDRMYWSFIRFADGKLVYRNGSSEFIATRVEP
jgi:CubicO group peptidase (beta-lactamase class C family)